MPDSRLLAMVGSEHGEEAFRVFYRRHEPRVLGYLRRRVPRAELAADLAAETFAAAVEAAHRFDAARSQEGSATGWLLMIAHNELATSLRRGRVADDARRRLGLTTPLVVDDAALARVDDLASPPETLHDALAGLSVQQRQAVLSRVIDEKSYAEIATAMDCSELVVRQHVSRGLARLRELLVLEGT